MSVKGWCPGAHRPMMSGDGLLVRIRPRLGRLSAGQMLGLCDIARTHGNGLMDLTSRANLQLRGVGEDSYDAVMQGLRTLDLLDEDAATEERRNITVSPLWKAGDITTRLHDALCARLHELPHLPAKMGVAIDVDRAPVLTRNSADFRIERSPRGTLILRADGLREGRAVSEETAIDALIEMAHWFAKHAGPDTRRMARLLATQDLPEGWRTTPARDPRPPLVPGGVIVGRAYGAAFGSIDAAALAELMHDSGASALRCTPWRLFVLEDARRTDPHGFVTDADDPLLRAHACPGAPACAAATVDTRAIARALAARHPKGLHVSGCDKGCAHPRPCATTLVGRDGAYDLVEDGHPWDQPRQRGLAHTDLLTVKA